VCVCVCVRVCVRICVCVCVCNFGAFVGFRFASLAFVMLPA